MKIGVLSDSHDNLIKIRKAVKLFLKAGIGAIIHAGDFCSPFFFQEVQDLKAICPGMYAVFGNNDGDRLLLSQKGSGFCEFKDAVFTMEIDGRKVVVMHYPDIAESLYRTGDYDLVIFGHTHHPIQRGDTKKLLNPGACSGYLSPGGRATIALFDTTDMGIEILTL